MSTLANAIAALDLLIKMNKLCTKCRMRVIQWRSICPDYDCCGHCKIAGRIYSEDSASAVELRLEEIASELLS